MDLSLARSGGVAVRLGTSRGSTVGLALDGGGAEVGKGSLAHSSKTLAGGVARLSVTLVSGQVERDEENEIRAEDGNTGKGSELLASALAGVGHPGPVSRGEVGVGSEVDED